MATLAGFVQQEWNTTGTATLTLSSLTAPGGGTVAATAGQMAIVEAAHSNSRSPLPSGWTPAGGSIHWRMLTAADIAAGSVTVKASLTSLTVLSGAAGIGQTGDDDDVKVRSATGGLFVRGWTSRWRSSLAPADYRIGAETTSSEDNHKHAVFFRAVTAAGYYDIPGTSDDAEFRAFEILGPTPPTAPTLTGPETGANVDRELPVLLSFVHQSAAGLPMQRCRVLVRPLGGTWVALKSDGTLDTVATTERVQSAGEAAIAAGVLTANTVYEWAVYAQDAGGWSPQSAVRNIVARSKSTATAAFATAHGDRSPTVTVTITPGTGTPRAIELRACLAADATPANPLWESGYIATTSTTVTLDLPASIDWANGASYRVWVLPTDSALAGVWAASNAGTVSWTPPAAPSSLVVADGAPPTATIAGIPAGTVRLDVWSVEDDTTRITIASPGVSVAVGLPLAPYAVARTYQTRAWASVDGVLVSSAWVTSDALTSADMNAYIVAEDQAAWVQLTVLEASAPAPIQAYATSQGLGALEPSVDRTPVGGWRGTWSALTGTAGEESTLLGWLTDPDRPRLRHKPTPERPLGNEPPVAVPAFLATVEKAPDPARLANTNTAGRRIAWTWVTSAEEDD